MHTKPHKEKVAIENLERQGFTAYCPQIVQSRRRRQRWQKVIEPLFPRYLFIRLNVGIDNFSSIRSTKGVVNLVRFGNNPAIMPESAIEVIQDQEKQIGSFDDRNLHWQKGDILEIVDGPFAGLKGIFHKKEAIERVSLLLDILGHQARFSMSINSLMKAS